MEEEGLLEPKRNGRNIKDGKAAKLMLVSRDKGPTVRSAGGGMINMVWDGW